MAGSLLDLVAADADDDSPPEGSTRKSAATEPGISARLISLAASRPYGHEQRHLNQAPIIFVDQVDPIPDDPTTHVLARTFRQALISALHRFEGVVVARTSPGTDPGIVKLLDANHHRRAYRFASEVRIAGDMLHLWWHLSDMRTMETYCTAQEEGPARLEGSIAEEFTAALVAMDILHAIAEREG